MFATVCYGFADWLPFFFFFCNTFFNRGWGVVSKIMGRDPVECDYIRDERSSSDRRAKTRTLKLLVFKDLLMQWRGISPRVVHVDEKPKSAIELTEIPPLAQEDIYTCGIARKFLPFLKNLPCHRFWQGGGLSAMLGVQRSHVLHLAVRPCGSQHSGWLARTASCWGKHVQAGLKGDR